MKQCSDRVAAGQTGKHESKHIHMVRFGVDVDMDADADVDVGVGVGLDVGVGS